MCCESCGDGTSKMFREIRPSKEASISLSLKGRQKEMKATQRHQTCFDDEVLLSLKKKNLHIYIKGLLLL